MFANRGADGAHPRSQASGTTLAPQRVQRWVGRLKTSAIDMP